MVREIGNGRPDLVVLDVGCATGYLAAELKQIGCRVYGIEVSPEAVREAAGHCEKVWCADLDFLEPLDCGRFFDIMIFADILEHTRAPEENIRKLLPYLRDDGILICSLPNVANWRVRFGLFFGRFDYSEVGILDDSHLRFFTLQTARRIFSDLGLRILQMSVTPSFLPYRLYRLRPIKWLDYALCRLLPRFGAQQFIFELQP